MGQNGRLEDSDVLDRMYVACCMDMGSVAQLLDHHIEHLEECEFGHMHTQRLLDTPPRMAYNCQCGNVDHRCGDHNPMAYHIQWHIHAFVGHHVGNRWYCIDVYGRIV